MRALSRSIVFALGLLSWSALNTSLVAADKPNVVVILTDDQGWGDLSVHGNTNLDTPNVDSLARDGALFERFYVCPVCSPTRAEFLTGRYHPRSNVSTTSTGGERMDLDEKTIAETFKAAGYATAAFGKWHNGQQHPYHPNARGFDEFYGFCSGHWGDYFSPPLDHNGEIVRGDGFMIDDFTNKAVAFMDAHKDGLFFAYIAFNTPHSPMQVPDRWWNQFKDKQLSLKGRKPKTELIGHTRAALAMCENIDWNVGRILERIDKLGIADNTIVLYFCDNGPNGPRWNGDMRGVKGTTDEGGVRSPLLMRWPREIRPGTRIPFVAGAIDLLPTLAALARVPVVGNNPLDGKNLAPLFRLAEEEITSAQAIPPEIRDRMIFSHWNGKVSVRTQQYRLDDVGRLYDMVADPGQRNDVSTRHPDVRKELTAAVESWRREVLAELAHDDRPFPVGHPDSKNTQLPAADGVPHGNIQRSAKPPNSSFFTNWKSPDDSIKWDVDILTSGDYDAELYYACPSSDVGSTVELSLGNSRLEGKVTAANDAPLAGAEHDRVPRGESYVKDFRPMKLGTIHLEKGRSQLALRALEVPGSQVMELRLLVLTPTAGKAGKEK